MMRGERRRCNRRSVCRIAVLAALLVGMLGGTVFGASTVKKYHDIPAYQMRDVYSQKQVKIGPIDVFNGRYSSDKPVDYDVTFTIYNSTLQKIDQVVTTKDGKLPELTLTEGFNYIFMVLDNSRWYMANRYYWVHNGNLCDIKSYEPNLKELQKRKGKDYKPTDKERENCYDRVNSITVMPFNNQSDSTDRLNGNRNDNIYVYYQGKEAEAGINIVFTSDRETITAKTDKYGREQPILLEDVNYMVSTDDPRYEIDPFPIAVKDKSEYSDSKIWSYVNRFFYDHSTCYRVGFINLTFYM